MSLQCANNSGERTLILSIIRNKFGRICNVKKKEIELIWMSTFVAESF